MRKILPLKALIITSVFSVFSASAATLMQNVSSGWENRRHHLAAT